MTTYILLVTFILLVSSFVGNGEEGDDMTFTLVKRNGEKDSGGLQKLLDIMKTSMPEIQKSSMFTNSSQIAKEYFSKLKIDDELQHKKAPLSVRRNSIVEAYWNYIEEQFLFIGWKLQTKKRFAYFIK